MSVLNAGFILVNLNWKWYLKDLDTVEKNGLNVFSCFSCGGGSSMGYKLAGFNVIGDCEIDQAMNKLYVANLHPRHNYLMDIREFEKIPNENLPPELFDLDVLDGSPPCSVFSAAGEREEGWGKEKKFREGQKAQRLDDLFFEFIKVADKLRPKVVIAENVKGLVSGKAKGYVHEIIKAFQGIGYDLQFFLLNSAFMGVPQVRERVFFIARRRDLNLPKIELGFNEQPIPFGEVRTEHGVPLGKDTESYRMLQARCPKDRRMSDIKTRVLGKCSSFNDYIWADERVCGTIASGGTYYRYFDGEKLSDQDYINVQTFPQDYDFINQSVHYVCGMSVPPLMMARIAHEVDRQLLRPVMQSGR